MGKRSRIGIAFLLIVILAGIAWLTFRTREPKYQGKSLSQWVDGYVQSLRDGETTKQTDEAVRYFGTNAIPTLLRKLQAKESPFTEKLVALAQKQKLIKVPYVRASNRNFGAYLGFMALGPEAKNAVPTLIELFDKNINQQQWAIADILGSIGPDARSAIPSLILGLRDKPWLERTAEQCARPRPNPF